MKLCIFMDTYVEILRLFRECEMEYLHIKNPFPLQILFHKKTTVNRNVLTHTYLIE